MAKVKIQGHASGTGVLTVTAPNTSTDRTITLPDATGTLLNSDGDGSNLTGTGSPSITDNGNATAITIDSRENVGIGVVPENWENPDWSALQIGGVGALYGSKNQVAGSECTLSRNEYRNSAGATSYIVTDMATRIVQDDGTIAFHTAASGSADAAITWTDALQITNDGRGLSQFTAKAWVNFNGTGTVAINDSHNVSSVTDNSTGNYTINFSNNMANTNYSLTSMSKAYSQYGNYSDSFGTFAVGSVGIEHREGASYTDAQKWCGNIFGD